MAYFLNMARPLLHYLELQVTQKALVLLDSVVSTSKLRSNLHSRYSYDGLWKNFLRRKLDKSAKIVSSQPPHTYLFACSQLLDSARRILLQGDLESYREILSLISQVLKKLEKEE